jgi:uncharacterized protein YjbJ (UPF0337 family)
VLGSLLADTGTAELRSYTEHRAIEGDEEMKSARRDKAGGTVDKIVGRVLQAFGKVTGNRSAGATGRAARGRGAGRSAKGRAKRSWR